MSKLMSIPEIEKAASEISSWLQDAAGDSAFTEDWDEIIWNFDHIPDIKKKVEQAKSWPVTDIRGWLADMIYDDEGWCSDLTGDRIHDEGKGYYPNMIGIAHKMQERAHDSLKNALQKHIIKWQSYMKPVTWKAIILAGGHLEKDVVIHIEIPYGFEITIPDDDVTWFDQITKVYEPDAPSIPDIEIKLEGE